VKNLVPRVQWWGTQMWNATARVYARNEILHFVQNDKDIGVVLTNIPAQQQPFGE
jgi:hypothetical protein